MRVFGAGVPPVAIGTITFATGMGWTVGALDFAVATLTTTSVSDPELVLDDRDPGRDPPPARIRERSAE